MLRKKTAAYALLAVYEIAQQQQGAADPLGVRAGDIAQKHKLPKAYAAKILSQLASAGVLHSDRGPRGGFRLSRPVEKISLFDVFQGVGVLSSPRSRGPIVKGLPNAVQSVLDRTDQEASNALRDLFMRTTLADLLKSSTVNTPPIRQQVPSLV
ncbi:MAG TPA: Rrf2 family transcriptional regulator [Phycisphaerae bacterium]|nr:Rrf2 family transcriptional regulator [Phycisphaerae bacterium]